MLKYFGHNSVFFDFRTTRRVILVREVVEREVAERVVVDWEVEE